MLEYHDLKYNLSILILIQTTMAIRSAEVIQLAYDTDEQVAITTFFSCNKQWTETNMDLS